MTKWRGGRRRIVKDSEPTDVPGSPMKEQCTRQCYRTTYMPLHCASLGQPHHEQWKSLGICPSDVLEKEILGRVTPPSKHLRYTGNLLPSSTRLEPTNGSTRPPSPPPSQPSRSRESPSNFRHSLLNPRRSRSSYLRRLHRAEQYRPGKRGKRNPTTWTTNRPSTTRSRSRT